MRCEKRHVRLPAGNPVPCGGDLRTLSGPEGSSSKVNSPGATGKLGFPQAAVLLFFVRFLFAFRESDFRGGYLYQSLDKLFKVVEIGRLRFMDALVEIIFQYLDARFLHGLSGCRQLEKNVVAGFLLDDHPLDTSKLTFDATKTVQHRFLILGQLFELFNERIFCHRSICPLSFFTMMCIRGIWYFVTGCWSTDLCDILSRSSIHTQTDGEDGAVFLKAVSAPNDVCGGKNHFAGGVILAVVSMKQLLECGVHFGHQTRRWNPKMKPYIFTERNGVYIIDLQKTVRGLEKAYDFVREVARNNGTLLFVGTKRQAQDTIKDEAERCGQFFINQRWLGGLLTNFPTIRKRVARMVELRKMEDEDNWSNLPKKEVILLRKELGKLEKYLKGITNMKAIPDAIFLIDPRREENAVLEARKLGVPVIAIVDTNCDPEMIDFPIPGNDDAIRAIKLVAGLMANAFIEGRQGEDSDAGVILRNESGEEVHDDSIIAVKERLHEVYDDTAEEA